MHELSLSQSIIDLAVDAAACEGLHRVSRVTVQVGVGAGVETDALRFCFDALAAQTPADGAELVIIPVALRARCRGCACDYAPASLIAACPACGSREKDLTAGRELRVKSIEGE
ncbi:MAG TPA: hydrogenase maturation nickel metallochaperone HypA [Steroidobacteraceae bacterium]|nr:hydrogenase maturation nickel metallochaperone HypA [Steroidobacteraceae bacterium]